MITTEARAQPLLFPQAVKFGAWEERGCHTPQISSHWRCRQASESLAPSHWALGGVMKLTLPGVGLAVPAQPADFQAKAESDTRIQLSWLLPPQERIIKYELVYWAAEDEGQQVSLRLGPGWRQG